MGGSYTVTVTGAIGSLSHSTRVTVNVQDFTLSASPASITIPVGGSGTGSIVVNSQGAFGGNLTLTVSAPSGLKAVLSPTSVVGSGASNLTITDTTAPAGSYLVNVTGVSGNLSHSVGVSVVVVLQQALPPSLSQMHWLHRLSLSRTGGVETWTVGVLNPNSNVTLYVNVQIIASDGSGTPGFTVNSGVIKLAPNTNLNNLPLSITVPASDLGHTLTWAAVIQYGTTSSLGASSTANEGVPTSGSFTVVS